MKIPAALFSASITNHQLFLMLSLLSYVISQTTYVDENMVLTCPASNNTPSYTFISNIRTLFNQKLYSEAGKSLYYNATEGQFPDTAYGLYLCKYDISFQSCQKCIVTAVNTVMNICDGAKETIIWFRECMVRYSDNSLSIMDTSTVLCMYIVRNVSVPENVTEILVQSFKEVIAIPSLSSLSYATKETNISGANTLRSYGQCIPVLSKEDCTECLQKSVDWVSKCFIRRGTGFGRIIFPSCNIGYELY